MEGSLTRENRVGLSRQAEGRDAVELELGGGASLRGNGNATVTAP